jgi:hypothetical protein
VIREAEERQRFEKSQFVQNEAMKAFKERDPGAFAAKWELVSV